MKRRIDLYHSPRDVSEKDLQGAVAIVVDVLRASNSIIMAIGNRCRRVLLVGEIDDAKTLAVQLKPEEVLLCGERDARMIPGFDLGNSPFEYQRERVHNRTLIFSSTNGSRALMSASRSKRAVVGSFANLSAVVENLKAENHIAILCAGRLGQLSLEDTVCGGAFVNAFLRACPGAWELSDAAAAAHALFLYHADNLLGTALSSEHGSYLSEIGVGEDIKFCVQVDSTSIVPVITVDDGQLVTVSSF